MSKGNWIKRELNLESFYKDIQNIFDKRSSLHETIGGGPILDLVFLYMLFTKTQERVNEYIGIETEDKCSSQNPTQYSSAHFESILWFLGLISLSWLIVNLNSKTRQGHCQNPNHESIEGHPYCPIGSEFHRGFYDALVASLNQLIIFASTQSPSVIKNTKLIWYILVTLFESELIYSIHATSFYSAPAALNQGSQNALNQYSLAWLRSHKFLYLLESKLSNSFAKTLADY